MAKSDGSPHLVAMPNASPATVLTSSYPRASCPTGTSVTGSDATCATRATADSVRARAAAIEARWAMALQGQDAASVEVSSDLEEEEGWEHRQELFT